ncbi:MAG: M20 family metallo-hydrolase [Thaumarchaeota archaeon]|nr:M20 family metallo-hydrolase [Nitrososphaerota archaeon]
MQATDIVSRIESDIDGDREKILDFFIRMLKINSVNPRMGGPGETERAKFIQTFLASEGFKVSGVDVPDAGYKDGVRPNIFTMIEGKDKSKTLWFLSHMDTVPEGSRELWETDPFDPVVKDGKVFARGAEDNGQSLVSSLFALRELKKLGVDLPFNVGIWGVADEEFGSEHGVKYLLDHGHFKPNDLVVVPDAGTPDGVSVEIAEKNLLWFKVTTKGKQVHASMPTRGKNAHRIGMELALNLDRIFHQKYTKTNDLFDDPFSTFEPTKVEPNVPNINTVPGIDVFYFDCRVLPEYSLDEVLSDVRSEIFSTQNRHNVEIDLEIINREDAGPATQSSSEVARLLEKAIYHITKKNPKFIGIGGQTVGNLFRKDGIPTAVWSTVDDIPHEPNEYSKIDNLISDAKVFAAMPLLAGQASLSQKF